MAIMVPDSCPSKATAGEKRLYGLLRDILPNNFTAWYEPVVQGRYPDFTILADTFGLLVLEVKGWYPKQIGKVTDSDVELHLTEEGQTRVEKARNPIRQVREYAFALMDQLRKHPLLLNHDGEHRGRLCFPCGYGVLLTNINRDQLDEAKLLSVFPPDRVLCRDELTDLEVGQDDRATIRRLRQLLGPGSFPFEPLTEDQIKTIHGVVHKEVVVKERPATDRSVPAGKDLPQGAVVLEVLDRRQEQVARSLGEGHRVFFGIAGSGKTVLLLARAKLIAGQDASKRVLVLCYNRSLAAYLDAQVAGDPGFRNVEVRTFHSWASRKTGLRSRGNEPFESYEKRLVGALLSANGWSEAERYDAILIDEAHDFDPDWFRCCTKALRDPQSSDLVIAVDGAQSLYGRPPSLTWKSRRSQRRGQEQAAGAELSQHPRDPRLRLGGRAGPHRGGRGERDPRRRPTGGRRPQRPRARLSGLFMPCGGTCGHRSSGRAIQEAGDRGAGHLCPLLEQQEEPHRRPVRRVEADGRGMLADEWPGPVGPRPIPVAPGSTALDDPLGQGAGVPGRHPFFAGPTPLLDPG
jgi:Nuclease-related domain/AAA domain